MLALALSCSLTVPAGAAGTTTDKQLSQVTASVKSTLGIGSEYTEFYGETSNNGVFTFWNLNWNSDDKSIMVEANDKGKVFTYYMNQEDYSEQNKGNLPSFPKVSRADALKTAEGFVKKVLGSGESAVFDTPDERSNMNQHYFNGKIQLNGIPSPITFSVTVNAKNNQVIRFYRSDSHDGFIGDIPAATPGSDKDKAAQDLKGTLKLDTVYVTDDENSKQAVLRYIPAKSDAYYVDAATGQLVNLTERYEEINKEGSYLYYETEDAAAYSGYSGSGGRGASNNAKEGPSADVELSKAEEEGIAKMEGVMSSAELDQKLRAISALGLDTQSLTSFNYWIDHEENKVYARLEYANKDKPESRRSYINVNARTGEIKTIDGYIPYVENRTASVTKEDAQKKAEDFLKSLWADKFAKLDLFDTDTENIDAGSYTFEFTRKENGYFYIPNTFTVSISVVDGTVTRLYYTFDDDISFQDPSGIISEEAAIDAWFKSYAATLGYMRIPVALDPNDPINEYLRAEGQNYYYGLGLAYYLSRETDYAGVDAKTGELVQQPDYSRPVITYSDIDSTWAKAQVEALAEYGIGYPGGKLLPTESLTQLDYVTLLVSTRSYTLDRDTSADDIYNYAYNMGILTPEKRNDKAILNRAETVKILLDYIGYGEVAQLKNIFRCTFSDADSIPEEYYGYAAIAQGMGLVNGNSNGAFSADKTITRIEAAVIVYNYMNR